LVTLFCDDTTTLQVMPSHLLTIEGALLELKNMLRWDMEVRKHMKDVQIDFDVCEGECKCYWYLCGVNTFFSGRAFNLFSQ
jgi:hypothetical protein